MSCVPDVVVAIVIASREMSSFSNHTQDSSESSLLRSGRPGKKDPILSDEQREALNTALSGAFSSMNSLAVEGEKKEDAAGEADKKVKKKKGEKLTGVR